mmetsp:Transcript_3256/g.7979  ORF Transcript_3256/g.7979 Transcript_3256/m.7979 type:complete len:210 (+) Transcript_3256:108-737(+)
MHTAALVRMVHGFVCVRPQRIPMRDCPACADLELVLAVALEPRVHLSGVGVDNVGAVVLALLAVVQSFGKKFGVHLDADEAVRAPCRHPLEHGYRGHRIFFARERNAVVVRKRKLEAYRLAQPVLKVNSDLVGEGAEELSQAVLLSRPLFRGRGDVAVGRAPQKLAEWLNGVERVHCLVQQRGPHRTLSGVHAYLGHAPFVGDVPSKVG